MTSLETERLLLRKTQMSDAPVIQELAAEYDVARYLLNMPHPYPPDGAVTWIQQVLELEANGEEGGFSITRKADGQFMGVIGMHFEKEHNRAEIGYWIGKPYWGQGYMSESVRRMIQHGFEAWGFNRIYARCFAPNIGSERVMQKAGLLYEGMMRQDVYKDGVYYDMKVCGLTRADYDRQH